MHQFIDQLLHENVIPQLHRFLLSIFWVVFTLCVCACLLALTYRIVLFVLTIGAA